MAHFRCCLLKGGLGPWAQFGGFCWVCFTCCGDDAHQHALEIHGGYFPGQDFVQAEMSWIKFGFVVLRQILPPNFVHISGLLNWDFNGILMGMNHGIFIDMKT